MVNGGQTKKDIQMKLLKFQASWCGPCKMLSKTLESMEVPYEIDQIDIDETPERAMKYSVRSIPTLIIVDETGTEIRRANGALNQNALKEFFR